jgi:hypothetical protein
MPALFLGKHQEKLRKANGERRKKQIEKGGRRIAKMRNGELSFRNLFSQSTFRISQFDILCRGRPLCLPIIQAMSGIS